MVEDVRERERLKKRVQQVAALMSADAIRPYNPSEIAAACGISEKEYTWLLSYPEREYIRRCFEITLNTRKKVKH